MIYKIEPKVYSSNKTKLINWKLLWLQSINKILKIYLMLPFLIDNYLINKQINRDLFKFITKIEKHNKILQAKLKNQTTIKTIWIS